MEDDVEIKEDSNGYSEGSISLRGEAIALVSSVSKAGVNNIDSLLSNYKWGTNTVSFSFPNSSADYTGYSASGEPYSNFAVLNTVQQDAARSALASWANVCNLSFTETTAGNGVIRFGTSSQPSTSWAYYPSASELGGDVWFGNSNSNSPSNPVVGSYSYATYVHEIGHALGLKHPHDTGGTAVAASSDIDSVEYSVMSYRSYVGAGLTGYTIASGSYYTGPMMDDIAAVQYMYGANYNYNSGDTVYTFDPTQTKIFETIWDGGGNDTYDLSLYTSNMSIDLRAGSWSVFNQSQLASLGNGHYAQGSVANALLYNGNTSSLIENAIGGSGNDSLTGNQINNVLNGGTGADYMVGGAGNDTYVVDNAGDSPVENANEGVDIVMSAITYTLGSNLENLTLTGNDNINGTGNALNNLITGSGGNNQLSGGAGDDTIHAGAGNDTIGGGAGNDYLDGGGGNDTLYGGVGDDALSGDLGADIIYGGIGNDTYIVDNIGDVIQENANEGTDTIQSSITYTLGDGVENIILIGTNSINGIGNALNNVIAGNAGDNTLSGNTGDDSMNGGAGNDTIGGGAGNDTISGGAGNDTVYGGLGNDVSGGGAGNDYIDGGAGNDNLYGGAGADALVGGLGDDTYIYGVGLGNDMINSYTGVNTENGFDTLQFQNLTLSSILFRQNANDLICTINQTGETVCLSNWLLGSAYQVDQFQFSDQTLTAMQIGQKIV